MLLARPRTLLALLLLTTAVLVGAPTLSAPRAQAAGTLTWTSAAGTTRTFAYGTRSPAQVLDATYLAGRTRQPWVLVIHGGSWYSGDKLSMVPAAKALRSAGFVVFNANYRLSVEAAWPAQRLDAEAALAWVRSHASKFGIDPDRGAVYGFSAGGQIASQLGTVGKGSGRVRAVVSIAGAVDPYRGWRYVHEQGAAQRDGVVMAPEMAWVADRSRFLVRCTPVRTDAACWNRWRDITPQTYASRDDAPHLLFAAADDPQVPWNSSASLDHQLRRAGVRSTFVKLATGGHAQAVVWGNAQRTRQAVEFLRANTR